MDVTISGWTFVQSDRRLGAWKPHNREYVIGPRGTWVPTADVDWLLSFKKSCPCRGGERIQIVSVGRPTARQMEQMPKEAPVLVEKSRFGLQAMGG